MSVIRWEDPPPINRAQRYDWAAIGVDLKSRPNEWAIVAIALNSPTAGQMARHIREGNYEPMGVLGVFESAARTVDGEARVYARYVGESS